MFVNNENSILEKHKSRTPSEYKLEVVQANFQVPLSRLPINIPTLCHNIEDSHRKTHILFNWKVDGKNINFKDNKSDRNAKE